MPLPLFFTEINRLPPASRRTETCVDYASKALSANLRAAGTGTPQFACSNLAAQSIGKIADGAVRVWRSLKHFRIPI